MTITFSESERCLAVCIEDDGIGFDVSDRHPPGHIGLIATKERIQLAGGQFHIFSEPSRGTAAMFCIPWSDRS